MKERWTVKDIRKLTGLTGKHLYYFHHEGVIPAAEFSTYTVDDRDGYKLYDAAGVAKLQQVAMYYELGLKRNEIRDLLKAPDYDMNRALDELTVQLEEKKRRMERHLAAIEQMRLVGVKNGLSEMFRAAPMEQWGRDRLAILQSEAEEWWMVDVTDEDMARFEETLGKTLTELNALDEAALAGDAGERICGALFRETVNLLGLPGFLFLLGMFLGALGGGELANLSEVELRVCFAPQHGQAALRWLKQDADQLLTDMAQTIAAYHNALDGAVDTPEAQALAGSIKELLRDHYGLKRKEEYRLLLDNLPIENTGLGHGYLKFVLEALKKHTEIC